MPDNTLSWPEVAARLAAARTYRLCITMPSGAPHAAPVSGVVTGQVLYLCRERRTVNARNLAADPRVVVHLESGEDVVIVRGTAKDLGTPTQVPDVVAALSAKYTGEHDRQGGAPGWGFELEAEIARRLGEPAVRQLRSTLLQILDRPADTRQGDPAGPPA